MSLVPSTCGVADPFALAGDGEIIRAVFCTFGDKMSIAGVVLLVWFTVSAMSYTQTKSVAMPMVLLLMMGGASLTLLPSVGLRVAGMLVLGGGAAIGVLVLRRLDRI